MRRPSSTLVWISIGVAAAVGASALARHNATEPPKTLAVGAAAPRFALRGTSGESVAFKPPVARPLVLAFVSTGCGHCARTAPELVSLARHGTAVLAIDSGSGSHDQRNAFAHDSLGGRGAAAGGPGRRGLTPLPRIGDADRRTVLRNGRPRRRGVGGGGSAPVGSRRPSRPLAVDLDEGAPDAAFTNTVVMRGGSVPGSEIAQYPCEGMPRRTKRTATCDGL